MLPSRDRLKVFGAFFWWGHVREGFNLKFDFYISFSLVSFRFFSFLVIVEIALARNLDWVSSRILLFD